jgi:DNA-binding CsgD family transcriptional regulator
MTESIHLDLIEKIYDVPLGTCDWNEVMLDLGRIFCAEVGVLLAFDRSRKTVRGLCLTGVDAAAWKQYQAYYAKLNPFVKAFDSNRMRSGQIMSATQLMPRKIFDRSEFYDGFWRPCGLGASAGGYLRDPQGRMLVIGLPRLRGVEDYADAELARLRVYFCHIARALQMQQEIERRRGAPDLDAFARRYGLTSAELRLLGMLIETGSLRKAAERLHRSYNTLRVQVRSILQKTGTRSQVELMMCIHRH